MRYLSEIFLRHSLDIGSLVFTWLDWAYILTFEFLCAGLNIETYDLVTFWFPGVSFWDLWSCLISIYYPIMWDSNKSTLCSAASKPFLFLWVTRWSLFKGFGWPRSDGDFCWMDAGLIIELTVLTFVSSCLLMPDTVTISYFLICPFSTLLLYFYERLENHMYYI